ncbi:hypothetical protein [Nocardioides halotolerans]|uniref:hypothetical protein n=1 Tax=Nocardioides halotolerans TaxID=433660 RepID=UPI00048BD961|nr:hypothetical protein [Nocardioides halotolerans]
MQILLWLVPPVLVTLVAMAWVGWVGREGRGAVDRDEAVRRLGEALEREQPARPARLPHRRERSTGVAVRRTPRSAVPPAAHPAPREGPRAAAEPAGEPGHEEQRRAG